MDGKHPVFQFLGREFWILYCIFSFSLQANPTFLLPTSFWYQNGFTLTESVEISKEGEKESTLFSLWLNRQTDAKRKKVIAILLAKGIKLNKRKELTPKSNEIKRKRITPTLINGIEIPEFSFWGGSYQLLDTRYLPLELRNHSSLYFGQSSKKSKWIIEKRDSEFTYGLELNDSRFHFYSGQRYKPLPNFYFAKDPDFFSNFDRRDSHLPQPLNESYFAGINLGMDRFAQKIGIYSAKTVSPEPGLYYVSPNKSYSASYAPHSKIGSFYINASFKNHFSSKWNSNIQGEGIGKAENYLGFIYLRSYQEDLNLKVDLTAYRDNQLLSLPTYDKLERNGIKQDLGYARIRFREYFVLDGLKSAEGLRYESGIGIQIPIWYGNWGGIITRYRSYVEEGFYLANSIGRGIFYEYRDQKTIIGIGSEWRDKHFQLEGKVSIPISSTYFLELSCLYREAGIAMRSWFENWSYATDFNVNLVDRREIWKLKFVGENLSLNLSISEKSDSPSYIYYANFQFNHKF